MERTQTKIVDSAAPERHELTDYIDDLGSVDDTIYGLLVDQEVLRCYDVKML